MVNQFWASSRIVSQNNIRTRAEDEPNNNNERTPQGILQRPQNHHVSLNNLGLGRYHVADTRTQPMVPFSFSGNNMRLPREICQNIGLTRIGVERHNQWEGEYEIPIIHQSLRTCTTQGILERPQNNRHVSLNNFTQGRYHEINSKTPPMAPNNDPQPLIGPHRITPSSTTNAVGFQGNANIFANPSRPFFHNRRSFRYLPYGESSNRVNNSVVFNDFNARRLSVDLHSFNYAILPITTPPSNANRDLARDRPQEIKLLDLFKDENNATTPTSSMNENDEENLDLSLHL